MNLRYDTIFSFSLSLPYFLSSSVYNNLTLRLEIGRADQSEENGNVTFATVGMKAVISCCQYW